MLVSSYQNNFRREFLLRLIETNLLNDAQASKFDSLKIAIKIIIDVLVVRFMDE